MPGRYDPVYEERGLDYPYPHVRWTEGRNLAAVLEFLRSGRLDLTPLLTHTFGIDDAERAYELVRGDAGEPFLGILLEYDGNGPSQPHTPLAGAAPGRAEGVRVGVIGAGQFASAVLLPALKADPAASLQVVTSSGGVTAEAMRRHFGFERVAASAEDVLAAGDVDAVVIATRHDSHAALVAASLRARRPCFVEKPLAIREEGLAAVLTAMEDAPGLVCVGFNRRFAPGVEALVARLRDRTSPLHARYRVNAGSLPAGHWTLDRDVGGGRILGECCHFLDLLAFVVGAPVQRVQAEAVGADGAVLLLRFADGSTAVLDYGTNGDGALPKELLEVHWEGLSLELDDFRSLVQHSRGKQSTLWSGAQDKGHQAELTAFVAAARTGGPSPVPFDEAVATTRAAFAALASMATGGAIDLRG